VNEEAVVHWGAVAPKIYQQKPPQGEVKIKKDTVIF
jgi:hypothetical protein